MYRDHRYVASSKISERRTVKVDGSVELELECNTDRETRNEKKIEKQDGMKHPSMFEFQKAPPCIALACAWRHLVMASAPSTRSQKKQMEMEEWPEK